MLNSDKENCREDGGCVDCLTLILGYAGVEVGGLTLDWRTNRELLIQTIISLRAQNQKLREKMERMVKAFVRLGQRDFFRD